jgi:hypothetical protein
MMREPGPGVRAGPVLQKGCERMASNDVDDILEAIRVRYRVLMADCKANDRVVTRAAAGIGWFDVDQVQGEGDLLALFGFDANKHEVMILQHPSQLNMVFTVAPADSAIEQKPLKIGFLEGE